MTSPAQSVQRDVGSPLVFDLIFIFAVWQLSHHLLVVAGACPSCSQPGQA
jgi:low temperature requirement protein LtrA